MCHFNSFNIKKKHLQFSKTVEMAEHKKISQKIIKIETNYIIFMTLPTKWEEVETVYICTKKITKN